MTLGSCRVKGYAGLGLPSLEPRTCTSSLWNQAQLGAPFGEDLTSPFIFLPQASLSLPTLFCFVFKVNFVLACRLDEFKCPPISIYLP